MPHFLSQHYGNKKCNVKMISIWLSGISTSTMFWLFIRKYGISALSRSLLRLIHHGKKLSLFCIKICK
jgi:hypothetical protein